MNSSAADPGVKNGRQELVWNELACMGYRDTVVVFVNCSFIMILNRVKPQEGSLIRGAKNGLACADYQRLELVRDTGTVHDKTREIN